MSRAIDRNNNKNALIILHDTGKSAREMMINLLTIAKQLCKECSFGFTSDEDGAITRASNDVEDAVFGWVKHIVQNKTRL